MAARSGVPSRVLGIVSALGLGSACGDPCEGQRSFDPPPEPELDPEGPPAVVAAGWVGPGVLELQFSRPIQSIGDLDPARFAIVAWNALVNDYEGYGVGEADYCEVRTSYRGLGSGYYYYQTSNAIAAAWIGPEDPTLLRVRVGNSAAQCPTPRGSVGGGVMLVYTDSNDETIGPGLLDGDGEPLAGFGPDWAVDRLTSCLEQTYCGLGFSASGHLPSLTSLVPISCP